MQVRNSTFRLLAIGFGALVFALTVSLSSIYWIAIGLGVVFGVAGLLIDYFIGSRFGRGQVSAWMLVAGGAALIFLNAKQRVLLSDGFGGWAVILQYVAIVVFVWGILLFLLPQKSKLAER